MGLDIKKYSYGYSMLQRLREGALQVEKNLGTLEQVYKDDNFTTKFTAFIEHNDCGGSHNTTSIFHSTLSLKCVYL